MHQILAWIYFEMVYVPLFLHKLPWVVKSFLSLFMVGLAVFINAKWFHFSITARWLNLGCWHLSLVIFSNILMCCFEMYTGNTLSRLLCPLQSLSLEKWESTSPPFLNGFSALTAGIWCQLRDSFASEWVVQIISVNNEGSLHIRT